MYDKFRNNPIKKQDENKILYDIIKNGKEKEKLADNAKKEYESELVYFKL